MSSIISERLLDKKRHTIGYTIGSTDYTRSQAIKEARQGRVSGVRVANGPKGPYLTSTIAGESLYSLPTRVVGAIRGGVASAATSARRTASKSARKTARKSTKR